MVLGFGGKIALGIATVGVTGLTGIYAVREFSPKNNQNPEDSQEGKPETVNDLQTTPRQEPTVSGPQPASGKVSKK